MLYLKIVKTGYGCIHKYDNRNKKLNNCNANTYFNRTYLEKCNFINMFNTQYVKYHA